MNFKHKYLFLLPGLLVLLGILIFPIGFTVRLSLSSWDSFFPGLDFIGLENYTSQVQVAILGSLAAILMVIKTFASLYLNKKIIFFLSILTAIFWCLAQFVNIYYFAVVGVIFEILWLPVLALLIVLPIISLVFLVKEKINIINKKPKI